MQTERQWRCGLRKAKHMNQSLLLKVGWGLIKNKDSLWARILRNKYGCGGDIIPKVSRKNHNSNLWLGVCKTLNKVMENTSWKLGNGRTIRFWDDCWVKPRFRLKEWTPGSLDESEINKTVSDFFLPNGDWNMEELK